MGLFIDKHFGAIGGFSTRRQMNEFVTVLPYSDLTEAGEILEGFCQGFPGAGNPGYLGRRSQADASGECIEFAILAGLAQGQPIAEIDSVIDSAKHQQKEIGRLRCVGRG